MLTNCFINTTILSWYLFKFIHSFKDELITHRGLPVENFEDNGNVLTEGDTGGDNAEVKQRY